MKTGVPWRFQLPEEAQNQTIEGGQTIGKLASIHLLDVMAMTVRAFAMVELGGEFIWQGSGRRL